MPISERQRITLARCIVDALTVPTSTGSDQTHSIVREIADYLERLRNAQVLLHHCQARGWSAAAEHQTRIVRRLAHDLHSLTDSLVNQPSVAVIPSAPPILPRDLLSDFDQLEQEFDHVSFDLKNRTVSVTTEPVTLEGRFLGAFEIVLSVRDLAHGRQRTPYKIVALDPHPAASNDAVTHPHVRDE